MNASGIDSSPLKRLSALLAVGCSSCTIFELGERVSMLGLLLAQLCRTTVFVSESADPSAIRNHVSVNPVAIQGRSSTFRATRINPKDNAVAVLALPSSGGLLSVVGNSVFIVA